MLNEEQKKAVAQWFAAGATLDEIQKRIKSEFGIHLTYLDLRLLVAELPQPEEKGDEPVEKKEEANDETPADQSADGSENSAASGVKVEIDPLAEAGLLAQGDVTFSDGTKAKWLLDGRGRLGMKDMPDGYRPSPEDAQEFQRNLVEALQAKGLM